MPFCLRGWLSVVSIGLIIGCIAFSPVAESEKVTIRVGHMWDQTRMEIQEQFDSWFMELHPEIQVESENLAWTPEAWVIRAAAGTLPDVIYTLGGWAGGFIEAGTFIDLTPYIESTPNFDIGDFYLRGFDKYRHQGGIYAIPYAWDPFIPFINRDIFNERGLTEPEEDWTYDSMLTAARRLTYDVDGDNLIDAWGLQFPPMGWNLDGLLLRPFGGRLLSADETSLAFDDPKTRDAMTWWINLVTQHSVAPPPANQAGAMFDNGRIAMVFDGSWSIPRYIQTLEFNWDVTTVPAGPAGRFTTAESSGYGITTQSKHPDQAWTYLNAYMSTQGQLMMWGNTYEQLSRRSAAIQALDLPGAPAGFSRFYHALENYALDAPSNSVLTDVYSIVATEVGKVLSGDMDIVAALETIQTTGSAVLARATN